MKKAPENIDLTAAQRKEITRLLKTHLPDTEVWAYGSRVKFTARPSSDLDMVAFATPEQKQAVYDLKEAFEESDLPFRVDLFIWDEVPEQFHRNIEAERVVLQERAAGDDIPEGWEYKALFEIGKIVTGKTPAISKKSGFGNLMPFVTPRDLDGSRIIFETERCLSEIGAKVLKNQILPPKSVMVSCIGSDMGKVAINATKCVTNQQINSIIVEEKYDYRYIYYNLSNRKKEIRGHAGGSALPILNKGDFSKLEIVLPPLTEQRAIAHILGSLDDKIELNRRMNETLEAMAQALFKSWFVDFDPVIDNALAAGNDIPEELKEKAAIREALGDARKPLPEEIQKLFPVEFEHTEEMGWIPKGWIFGNLGDIALQKRNSADLSLISSDTPYIGLEHMPMKSISLGSWEIAEKVISGKSCFAAGDILFGKLRPYFHKVGVAPIDGICSTDIVVILPKEPDLFAFALCVISSKSFVDYTSAGVTGTKMPRTSWKDMATYRVLIPLKNVYVIFDDIICPFINRIIYNVLENRLLAQLRERLVPKLLSGEIRIIENQ
jgi:type I restriction enzyme S subunit